jgi:hypothetical protein
VGDALFTAPSQAAAQSTLGLGTMAVENSNAVSITGGSINGTSIGTVTPVTGLTATGPGHIDNIIIGATVPAAASVTSMNGGQLAGMRNRIINGDFRIDQRYAGANLTASGYFGDRWAFTSTQAGGLAFAQKYAGTSIGGVVIGYYGGGDIATAFVAPGAGDVVIIAQRIEGQNIVDLLWGAAGAKTVTLSGMIALTANTGNVAIAVRNGAATSSYVTTVNVPAANTWTPFAVTVSGPTSGTWAHDNTAGIEITFSLGAGATYTAPSTNSWLSGNFVHVAGAVNMLSQAGAQLLLANVQLELGSTATPFEQRLIGTELALCQRYYRRHTAAAANIIYFSGYGVAATSVNWQWFLSPPMRAAPTGSIIGNWGSNNTGAPAFGSTSPDGFNLSAIAVATGFVVLANPANGGFDLSAEL